MAKPRVFISSTFYDLRHVREDLERFITELGYEAVRNETGAIPYEKQEKLETSAFREVELCDVLVAIVGGRFGADSQEDLGYSISQAEVRRALERGIQVFIFVERGVFNEYSTYQINKTTADVKYRFVDNVKIYEFIEHLFALPRNNPIAPFSTSSEIVEYLRAQWAGLFQRFLQQQTRMPEMKIIEEMTSTSKTLQDLVTFLTTERKNKDEAIRNILLATHPAFRHFAEATGTPYRVFFTNRKELNAWLKARSWLQVKKDSLDSDSVAEWSHDKRYIKLTHDIFEKGGQLKVLSEGEWSTEWLQSLPIPPEEIADPSST